LTSQSPLGTRVHPRRFSVKTNLESTSGDSNSRNNHVLTVEWRTLLFACSSAGAETARSFCSIGPLSLAADNEVQVPTSHDHTRFQADALPFVKLSQTPRVPSGRNSGRSAAVIEIDIPSILLNLSKPIFDSLQFWIDDVSQVLERATATSSEASQENSSRNPSLVGSRFFSASKQSSVEVTADEISTGHIKSSTENIVKVTLSEGQRLSYITLTPLSLDPGSVRLLVPRIEGEFDSVEPFDIFVSDVDVLLESKPEGKVRFFYYY
jgi:autophagy-related protein 2